MTLTAKDINWKKISGPKNLKKGGVARYELKFKMPLTKWSKTDGGGLRNDAGKLRLDLLPNDALRSVAEVLTHGIKKYAERNWERGMQWSKVYGPLLRHLNAWAEGEVIDRESGQPHMAHVACNALFLLTYELRGMRQFEDIEPYLRDAKKKKA
jgi:hypothetical protein